MSTQLAPMSTNAQWAEESATILWTFFDQSNTTSGPRFVEIPLSLFCGSSRECQQLFALGLLDNFGFRADKSSVIFWKPKQQLSIHTTMKANWMERIGDLQDFFTEIPLTGSLSEALGRGIDDKNAVHLIVTACAYIVPTTPSIAMSRTGSQPPIILEHWTPRSATVKALYERLMKFRLVQVRGTPGSGKTTLMELLHTYILSQDHQAIVEVIKGWPKSNLEAIEERISSRIKSFPCAKPHYLLFDNAQDTYWDGLLWENFFKDTIQRGVGPFVILFCSYGSPTARPVDYDHGTPLFLGHNARISLTPHDPSKPERSRIGLLFSQAEFEQAVNRFKGPDLSFIQVDPELRRTLFEWTMGHAGAVGDLLRSLSYAERKFLRDGGMLTVNHLLKMEKSGDLFSDLPNFSRGLPGEKDLQKLGIATIFRKLLSQGGSMVESGGADEAYCHRHGWMHSELHSGQIHFSFSSPLHGMYIASKLIPASGDLPFDTVEDMAFSIIKKFNPSQLSSPSRMGVAFSDRPLEARYQFEFYHGLFLATGGGVCICPELLTALGAPKLGRIDFFIPGKKWGIELTREGNGLLEHSAQFSPGSKYGVWLASKDMVDYILLDCCTNTPRLAHPEIKNLFHAVFEDQFCQVTILNNKLEKIEGPVSLLAH